MTVQLSQVISARAKSLGSVLSVRSLELGSERSSPVIVVDDFRVSGRAFGPHPHAGFSAMTYVFRDSPGSLRNRDSLGGHVVVGPGGVCWLQAGSGAQHEEIPAEAGKELLGLQVFVNLSRKNKLTSPRTLSLPGDDVPMWKSPNGDDVVRVVIGSYEGVTSELAPLEPFTLLDVELRRQIGVRVGAQENVVLYVRRGSVVIEADGGTRSLSGGQAVVAHGGPGSLRAMTSSSADVVILSGAEIRERVLVHGPFVMNDQAQIEEAAERYRSGRMGTLEPFSEG